MKKQITQTSSPDVETMLMACSKAALADLVIDLIRRSHGEWLEGPELAAELRTAFEPILLARGDRQPK